MFRSARHHVAKNSVPSRPRFAPRLETLESRFAPACSFNTSTNVLTSTASETVLLYYVPWSDGQDIYCNFQYVGTNYTDLWLTGNGNNKIEIDTTLSTTAGNYLLAGAGDHVGQAQFGNTIYFNSEAVNDVAFILGVGANTVTIVPPTYFLLPIATVVGWNSANPSNVVVDDSAYPGPNYYTVTQNQISLGSQLGLIANYYWIDEISVHTGGNFNYIDVKNTAGSLGTMPLIYLFGNSISDTLTVDASAYSTPEKYNFDQERMSMPDYLRNIVWYRYIEYITLKAGSGNDQITLKNTVGNLTGIPLITVNGGGGIDSLTADNSTYSYGETYYLTELGLAWVGLGDRFYYPNVESVTFKTGTGEDHIRIGSNQNKLAGIPDIDVQAGTGAANYLYFTDSANNASETYTFTETQLLMPNSLGLVASFSDISYFHLYAGSETNNVKLAPLGGTVLAMAKYFGVHGGAGGDTISIYDQENPNSTTYIATSNSPGAGAVTIPGSNFGAYFDSTNVVNLYRSLKPGTTVNINNYNPAHYVLNIFPENDDMSGSPPDEQAEDPPDIDHPPPLPNTESDPVVPTVAFAERRDPGALLRGCSRLNRATHRLVRQPEPAGIRSNTLS